MGSSSEALKASQVYRNLLRAVKKHIGQTEHHTHFSDFIKHEFRNDHPPPPPPPQQSENSVIYQKLKLASDYTYYLNSVHHHKTPLFHSGVLPTCNGQLLPDFAGIPTLKKLWVWDPCIWGHTRRKGLLFSYNIAVDRSEEVRRVLGKSAASVGLCLPDVYQP